ncbi:MAG: ATP-dependent DNA ligase [Saprospiraceae bacterium]|nr:ATP-dependent DNA ligase [Saprospiraceae bacterium]
MDSFDFGIQCPVGSDYRKTATPKPKNGATKIYSRSGRNISVQFPEICEKLNDIDGECFVLDGELVSLDEKGIPIFANIISRMHAKSITPSQHNASFYVFDILYLDGKDCRSLTLGKRKEWLDTILKPNAKIRISQSFNDGVALFEAAKANNMEGIMAKKSNSTYQSARSSNWQKIKVRTVIDVKIVGYTQGKGDRSTLFGALHVTSINDKTYLGKVGTGFDETKMKEIFSIIRDKGIIAKPFTINIEEEYNTVWIDCDQQCEVQYASFTPNGTLRNQFF